MDHLPPRKESFKLRLGSADGASTYELYIKLEQKMFLEAGKHQ